MKVYLDMDGVLADFFGEAVKLSPTPYVGWRDMEYRDIQQALRNVRATKNFFYDLYAYPGTNTLVQSVVNLFGEYHICSSPMEGYEGDCRQEKIEWIEQNLLIRPASIKITSHKPQYAEGNILIDDYGVNIQNWELAGGYGIKYQADEDPLSNALIPLMTLAKQQP